MTLYESKFRLDFPVTLGSDIESLKNVRRYLETPLPEYFSKHSFPPPVLARDGREGFGTSILTSNGFEDMTE